eukprot:gnl/MRDRNA2_/MRDRNA2_32353_c0_seq1.p1 gnl/MRDRNA2_/MRDRNA2_32353_c0~~gnl/MRDRNA2_/MRDRNA2_32353_c0_seq1.p1  ORF type:complete len:594 (-),score=113.33 gnl/MRDRNA2_/MRDRNA2_32353_c0_seq1:77-1696(-)
MADAALPVQGTGGITGLCDLYTSHGIWYLEQILQAKVYDVAVETPLTHLTGVSLKTGNTVLAKREDMQPVFSFKIRGAYNLISSLPDDVKKRGIITASAGNHAQGTAYSSMKLGIKAVVCMPKVTPSIKVNNVKRFGGDVVLVGDNFDETLKYALQRSEEEGLTFIPPFDHPLVIAGQGTVGLEILRQFTKGPIHAIFCPVGGGGLISGIAAYVKRINPNIKIIGVEPYGACALYKSFKAGQRIRLDQVDTFADGVATKAVGEECWRIMRQLVDEVVLVDTDDICIAIKDIFEDTRSISEPSGALSLAGLKKYAAEHGLQDENLVCISSGANMNFDKLKVVCDRSGSGTQESALLVSTLTERPGEFLRFIQTLVHAGNAQSSGRSISEFKYRYNAEKTRETGNAQVFYSVTTSGREDTELLVQQMNEQGVTTMDLSKSELAKDHLRFMTGGGTYDEMEHFFSIEFPERPGALETFLEQIGDKYNISLFHYRATGGLIGKVFLGICPLEDVEVKTFLELVESLGWFCVEETSNSAMALLL